MIFDAGEDVLDYFGMKFMPGESKNAATYGFELEANVRRDYDIDDVAAEMHSFLENTRMGILKEDGSLDSDTGFELVTIPASFDFWMKSGWIDEFNARFGSKIKSFNCRETGLHVHVGGKAFNDIDAKLRAFSMINFDVSLKELLDVAAQRPSNSWAYRIYNDSYRVDRLKSEFKNNVNRQCRDYLALTPASGQNTLEFRLFKGNTAPEALYSAIQFVDAVKEYSNAGFDDSVAQLNGFTNFIASAPERYGKIGKRIERFLPVSAVSSIDARKAELVKVEA